MNVRHIAHLSAVAALILLTDGALPRAASESIEHTQPRTALAGTSIVVIMTSDELWVAADSRVIAVGTTTEAAADGCKIHRAGAFYFAQAGLFKDAAGRFDAVATAEAAARGASTVPGAAAAFEREITGPLQGIVTELRHQNPSYYRAKLLGRAALEVAFFGLQSGKPRLAVRRFLVDEGPESQVRVSPKHLDCPGDCPTGMTWAMLGEAAAINRFLDDNPGYLAANGFRTTLEKLITVEANDEPEFVTLPVDVLRVATPAPAWLQRKAACSDRTH